MQNRRYSFDVFLWGIKVGELVYSVKKTSDEYDISGVLRSKGFARVVTKYKFEAQTKGKVSIQNITLPLTAKNQIQVVERAEIHNLSKNDTKINLCKSSKTSLGKAKVSKGTVDPMTAIHLIMGDRIEKTLCKQKFNLFDGARRIEIILSKINIEKNSAQCRGEYIRQDGYTEEEMKEGKGFPFTINYIKRDEIYAVESLR